MAMDNALITENDMKEEQMRAEFEAWVSKDITEENGYCITSVDDEVPLMYVSENGKYHHTSMQLRWEGYQAALNSQAKSVPEDLAEMFTVIECADHILRKQTYSGDRDYWEVKMKGIEEPYQDGKDDIKRLLRTIYKDLFTNHDAAPQPPQEDRVRELEVTRNNYGVNISGLPCYVIEYITPLKFVLRNGELADYDSELANRLQELLDWLAAMKEPNTLEGGE